VLALASMHKERVVVLSKECSAKSAQQRVLSKE